MAIGRDFLIIGGDSRLGIAVAKCLKSRKKTVITTTRRMGGRENSGLYLDLSEDPSGWRVPKDINTAFFCAAITSVEECRLRPAESRRINVENTLLLASRLVEAGATVVFPSSNLVFDGEAFGCKIDDPVCPRSQYGKLKAEAEERLRRLGGSVSIIRYTKLVDSHTALFKNWLESLSKGMVIKPFSDMVAAPLPMAFASRVAAEVALNGGTGIWQASARQDVTYEQIAVHFARRLHVSPELVQPIRARDSGLVRDMVPTHTVLDTSRIERELGLNPPEVWDTVDSLLERSE